MPTPRGLAVLRTAATRLRTILESEGITVIGEAGDGAEALTATRALRPDVVCMDVRMPEVDGLEATRRVRAEPDPPPVLVLTTFSDDDVLWSAIEAGAGGFVLKDTTAQNLIAATRAVAGGGAWLDRVVAPRVLAAYRGSVAPGRREARLLERLTDREAEVLQRMARGATNREIAYELHVSEGTVKSHVGSIFMKLGVRDRPAAIVFAFDHGVVGPGGRTA